MNDDTSNTQPILGGLFTRNYLRPDAPLKDSTEMRMRIGRYADQLINDAYRLKLNEFLMIEGGISLPSIGSTCFVDLYLNEAPVPKVLNAITLIWRFLSYQWVIKQKTGYSADWAQDRKATEWLTFVRRVFTEEAMGYRADDACGVHYVVDAEFERVVASAISLLGKPRYAGVKASFDQALRFLDQAMPDTKSSVKAAFEALEILARLIVPEAQNLNKKMIEEKLNPIVLSSINDVTEKEAMRAALSGLAAFVNGVHFYRHGQGREDPVAPSMDSAIYIVSNIASAVRLLAVVDDARSSG